MAGGRPARLDDGAVVAARPRGRDHRPRLGRIEPDSDGDPAGDLEPPRVWEALDDAVAAPRIHFENGTLGVEPGFADAAIARAGAEGDAVERWDALNMFFGGVHAVRRRADGGLEGAGDPRRGGVSTLA